MRKEPISRDENASIRMFAKMFGIQFEMLDVIWHFIESSYKEEINESRRFADIILNNLENVQYNIEKRPVCKVCGKKVNYICNGNYRNVCSFKCGEIYCRERRFKTMIDKYGTPYPYKNKDIMNYLKLEEQKVMQLN